MTARATIFQGEDYSLHASLVPVISPKGGYALTFTSLRMAVRNPGEEHVRFFGCFEREGLQSLVRLIEEQLRADEALRSPAGNAGQEALK